MYEERYASEGTTFTPWQWTDILEIWHPVAMAAITRPGRQLARNVSRGDEDCYLSPKAFSTMRATMAECFFHCDILLVMSKQILKRPEPQMT